MSTLTLGASKRHIDDPVEHVQAYLDASFVKRGGYYYRNSRGVEGHSLPHELFTLSSMIVGSHVGLRARSFHEQASNFELSKVPKTPLEKAGEEELAALAEAIVAVARWDGFAASAASKLLHPARPAGIPVLDRDAIGGAYTRAEWQGGPTPPRSIYYSELVEVLRLYQGDLTEPSNEEAWQKLGRHTSASFTRLQLLDMVWWVHFRRTRR